MGKTEAQLLIVMVLLTLLGFICVYSTSFMLGYRLYGEPLAFLIRQLLGAGLGLALLVMFWLVDYHRWAEVDDLLLLGVFLLSLATLVPGVASGGRWLRLGPVSFQPTELGKLALIIYIASSLVRRGERVKSFQEGVAPYLVVMAGFGLVLLLQPDLGMLVLYVAVTGFLLFAGGVRLHLLALTALGGLPLVGLLVVAAPYRLGRLLAFLNPAAYQETYGYQVFQSMLAIGSGGLWGRGLGASRAKLFYLPAVHNDFAFAAWAEETGLVGSLVLMGLLGWLVTAGLRVARLAPDRLGTLYALGATFVLGFQSLVNLGVVVGVLPVTGLTLPFISYGGSSLAVTLGLVGLLLGVARLARQGPPLREEGAG